MRAHGRRQHFRRQPALADRLDQRLIDPPTEHHRPLCKPGDFVEKPLVLDQHAARLFRKRAGLGKDQFLAILGRKNDAGIFQLRHIILVARDREGFGRMKAMAARAVAARDAVDLERHHRTFEHAQDRMQRAHPAQLPRPPAHGFGPRERADDVRHNVGNDIGGLAALVKNKGHIKRALLILADLACVERGEPRRFEEPVDRALGRPHLGALLFLGAVRLLKRQAFEQQRKTARPCKAFGGARNNTGLAQLFDHEALQILTRARLHARRNLLAEEFEQEFSHGWPLSRCRRRAGFQASPRSRPSQARAHGQCRPRARSPR